MKTERIETLTDSFTDFKGLVHHFVVAAISEVLPEESLDGVPLYNEVVVEEGDCGAVKSIGYVTKGVKLGIAICNPVDYFDEEVGKRIAINKARTSEFALFSSKLGYINTTMIQAFLRQEAIYLKNNPGQYIKGYSDAERDYKEALMMEEERKLLNEYEQNIIEQCKTDQNYFRRLLNFIINDKRK